jgi:serine/threonine protein kinase/formylglycine-generating enzyme required for sulfatase activity
MNADPRTNEELLDAAKKGSEGALPAQANEIREMLPALALMEAKSPQASDPGPSPPATALPGARPLQQLGDYQILREIGRGGMGVVYEAQQLSLGRHVAIKVLPSQALLDVQRLGRFQREARSAAKLHHTNIVPVFGVGEQDGAHYYVMQFIQGLGLDKVLNELRSLRQSGGKHTPLRGDAAVSPTNAAWNLSAVDVARGLLTGYRQHDPSSVGSTTPGDSAAQVKLSARTPVRAADTSATIRLPGQAESSTLTETGHQYWQSVARIGMQVADALAHAASQGILHRDIKPSNLLLDGTGNVWVTDFGLAKAASGDDDLTHTGDVVGTVRYMAPERFSGQGDIRSDVYSLGLTLYELLTLRPAFGNADRSKLVRQVMHDEPVQPRKLNPRVPRDLETVVLKAIARDPAHRYQTPALMVEDLNRFVEDRPVRARRVSEAEKLWRWCRRNPSVASLLAGIVLVFLAGFAGVFWQWRVAETQQEEAEKQAGIALTREREALQEAEKAKKAREFLVSIFQISERDTQGGNITARQILADAERRIPVEFADQPDLRADLMAAVEKVKRSIGRTTPQAMILEVRGAVQLQSSAGVKKAAVAQALLNLDDRLKLSDGGQLQLVFLSDFHKERLKPGREATIDWKGCQPAEAVLERDNSLLMTFVHLPKGTFYMGGGGGKAGKKTEIKEDFEIAVHDVTQGQWQAVMGQNPSWFKRDGSGSGSVRDISDEELKLFPVENVSWDDAQEFIKKLNEIDRGRGYVYRLPTEAEWEYACRGGATSEKECSYYFYSDKPSNDLSSEQANFDGKSLGGKGKHLQRPTRVGAYPPNKLGLCDMHGNVSQWCADGLEGGGLRATRGGSWNAYGHTCQATSRSVSLPTLRDHYRGFRLARVPAQ